MVNRQETWQKTRSILGRFVQPVIILGAAVAIFASISQRPPTPQKPGQELPLPSVATAYVSEFKSILDLKSDGLVVPYREVNVAAEVSGRIVSKSQNCRPGRVVSVGELLFQIDRQPYELEVQRLTAELEQRQSNVHELEVESQNIQRLLTIAQQRLDLRNKDVDRVNSLVERNAVSTSDVEDALNMQLESSSSVATLQNQMDQAKAKIETQRKILQASAVSLDKAKLDLERTRIVSPMNGVILESTSEENSYVQIGTSLAKIEDTSAVEIRSSLRMDELNWIVRHRHENHDERDPYSLPQLDVTVHYQIAGDSYEWLGKLHSYDGLGLDERTRTVPVRIRVDNPTVSTSAELSKTTPRLLLMRGMYVQTTMHIQSGAKLYSLPEAAIQPGNFVWKVQGGKLAKTPLSVIQARAGTVIIDGERSAIQSGDKVVISPISSPIDGMQVREAGN